MKKAFARIATAVAIVSLVLSSGSAEARARKGGHFVGGHGSHHKGGTEIGGT